MKRLFFVAIRIVATFCTGGVLVAILLAESAIRAPVPRHTPDSRFLRQFNTMGAMSHWQDAEIKSPDGVTLNAWWLSPHGDVRGSVIVLHGIGDSRMGGLGHAGYLLRAGYAVLLPDLRGHGTSGGDLITYGVAERRDITSWQVWMERQYQKPVFGIGVSMGAAILLQSLPDSNFAAVVAESPFSCFDRIAMDRMRQFGPGFTAVTESLYPSILRTAFRYTSLRYGINLEAACPEFSIQADPRHTPILLIHGSADTNISPEHSRRLVRRGLPGVVYWEVPAAGHVQVLAVAGEQYRERVLDHFSAPH